jgi:serine/threonine protein kinase
MASTASTASTQPFLNSWSSESNQAGESDMQQVASVYFTEDSGEKRRPLRAMSVRITDGNKPLCKYLHILDGHGGEKTVPLHGARAWILNVSSHPGDVQPSFAENSVCIRVPESTVGWIVAHPTQQDQLHFLDLVCLAGCLVRDLPAQIAFLPEDDQPSASLRLGTPITSRTSTSNEIVALKVATDKDKMSQLFDEANVLLNLRHEGIVRAYGLYEVRVNDKRSLGMVLDYKMGRDLSYWIPADGMPESLARGVVAQACDSIVYLHGRGVVHRDIKPSNVLCERAKDGSVHVVLADFGLASNVMNTEKMSTRCGTGGFVAPEMFQTDWPIQVKEETINVLTKIDVFSLGMMTYTLIFGTNPFSASTLDGIYLRNARCLIPLEDAEGRSAELMSFLSKVCAKNPRQRYSSSEASAHAWFVADGGDHTKVMWDAFEQATYE